MPSALRSSATVVCLVTAALLAAACSKTPKVQVPPRVDLARYGTIGVIDFSSRPDARHASPATRRFVQMLQQSQPGTPILELGTRQQVLAKVGREDLDFETVRAIGEAYRVDAVLCGDLEFSKVKNSVRIGTAFDSVNASANLNGQLEARIMEARAGATVWAKRTTATANLAHVGVGTGSPLPTFGATDRGDVEDGLVGELVASQRADFVPRWVKQQ